MTAPGAFGTIDQLTYTYGDATRPDRLTQVADAGSTTKGFKYLSGAGSYTYDANGNLTRDNHKDLTFNYNHLNLPNSINNSADSYITLTYTADGEKLTKVASGVTRNYVSGIEYAGANLEAIYHSEGRCTPNGATAFFYEYTLKDHLGNARVNFRANGTAVTFLEELHYYPFGLQMEGIGTAAVTQNKYRYNSKEINEDLGLNLSDYGARWYDAALGRWWSIDPLAEAYAPHSPYNYVMGNPMVLVDPTGMATQAYDAGGEEWRDSPIGRKKPEDKDKKNEEEEQANNTDGSSTKKKVPYGTRVYVNGELLSDTVEGYIEVSGEAASAEVTSEICPPCIAIIFGMLMAAPEVAKNRTGRSDDDENIQKYEELSNGIKLTAITLPARAEGYVAEAASKRLMLSLSKSQMKSIASYERLIAEHQKKLEEYMNNPHNFDNMGYLKDAINDAIKQRIIQKRIEHLQTEIKTFENNIQKILNGQ